MTKEKGEIMAITTVSKWGNSLAIRIPSDIAKEASFEVGKEVILTMNQNKVIAQLKSPQNEDEFLKNHLAQLRAQCKPGMHMHNEKFIANMGSENI